MKVRAIITGATGMVGEGVLHECLIHDDVEEVLIVNRSSLGIKHAKLKEIVHKDFFDLSSIKDQLQGYNACFFCLGVSSVGMKEEEYNHLTYDLTINFAKTVASPGMTICYISGVGTDSSAKGRSMWARVKGRTENDLRTLPFKKAVAFRPGYIQPTKGLKNAYKIYKIFTPLYPALRAMFPKYVCSLKEIGLAMINTVLKETEKQVLEVKDIVELAKV